MSRQCLSASGAGRALTPARHLRLGGPLPRQLANITWAPPRAINLCSPEIIRYYPPSRTAIPNPRVDTHALLPLTPVPPLLGFPRLACLIHAANVRSEPGSNPSKCIVDNPNPYGLRIARIVEFVPAASQPDSKNSIGPRRGTSTATLHQPGSRSSRPTARPEPHLFRTQLSKSDVSRRTTVSSRRSTHW